MTAKYTEPIRLYFINVGGPKQKGFTKIFQLLYAIFNGKLEVVKEIYSEYDLILSDDLKTEVNEFMTLDQARIAEGIKIGLEKGRAEGEEKGIAKGRTETEKEKRKDLIEALHSEGESKDKINRLLSKTHNQPLTDEEIKELGL